MCRRTQECSGREEFFSCETVAKQRNGREKLLKRRVNHHPRARLYEMYNNINNIIHFV